MIDYQDREYLKRARQRYKLGDAIGEVIGALLCICTIVALMFGPAIMRWLS